MLGDWEGGRMELWGGSRWLGVVNEESLRSYGCPQRWAVRAYMYP